MDGHRVSKYGPKFGAGSSLPEPDNAVSREEVITIQVATPNLDAALHDVHELEISEADRRL
jgi:hypothetical protein